MNLKYIEIIIQEELESLLGEDMPRQGIIAGQGLAALVLSFLWGRKIPVECLDLYKDWPDEALEEYGQIHYSRPSLDDDSYQFISPNGFSVLTSDSKGILNTHVIQRCQANFGKYRTMVILYALNLNAFGVGYDCYSKKIYITEDFAEFSHSKQLRIQSPVSTESLLELLKCQHIFDCYVDLDEEVKLLVGYRKISGKQGDIGGYNDCVSAPGKLIFDDYKLVLEPFCSLLEFEQPVLPGFEVPMGMQYQLVFRIDADTDIFAQLIEPLLQKIDVRFDSYIFTVFFNVLLRKSSSNVFKSRLRTTLSYPTAVSMVLFNPDCLQGDFAEKHIQVIEKFTTVHPFCVKTLMSLNLSIFGMYKAISLIQAFSKNNGNQIIGLIETHKRIGYKLATISQQALEELVDAYRTTAGIPLVENQVDLSSFEYRASVAELTTTTELEIEGWRMNNCVGGYAAILKSNEGRTRIFHIDGLSPSTAAIYYEEERRDVTFEVYGHSNRDALQEHLVVAERLGSYLFNTLWNKGETNNMLYFE